MKIDLLRPVETPHFTLFPDESKTLKSRNDHTNRWTKKIPKQETLDILKPKIFSHIY